MREFRLCYIKNGKAWFTDSFDNQWGDDWNDKPYEYNAGEPYDDWTEDSGIKHRIELQTLYFETNSWSEKEPCDMGEFSVEEINKGTVAWLHTDDYNIMAGALMEEFIKTVMDNGGMVFLPFGN